MKKYNAVQIETLPQRRFAGRVCSSNQLHKAELNDIAASEVLVLATAIAQAVVSGLEMRERRKDRRFMLLAACVLATLIGLARLAVRVFQIG